MDLEVSRVTVYRLQFVPFGTVKSVFNAAKAGFPSDKEIEVRHASKQPKTAATGADHEVRCRLQLHSMQVAESPHQIASHLMYSQDGAAAKACESRKLESTGANDTACTDSIKEDVKPRTVRVRC